MSQSNGFKKQVSHSNGFSNSNYQATMRRDEDWQTSSNALVKTQKLDSLKAKALSNVQKSQERKKKIIDYLGKDDFSQTVFRFSQQPQDLQPQLKSSYSDPFDQRIFSKTQNLMEQSDSSQLANIKKLPGVLSLGNCKSTDLPKSRQRKQPIVLIQSFVRRFLARVDFLRKKEQFQKMLADHKDDQQVKRLIKADLSVADKIANQLNKQKQEREARVYAPEKPGILGLDKNNAFYTTMIEILGEKGVLEQDDFIGQNRFPSQEQEKPKAVIFSEQVEVSKKAKFRPNSQIKIQPKILDFKVQDDGNGVWAAYYKKTLQKNYVPVEKVQVETSQMQATIDEGKLSQVSEQRKAKIKRLLDKQVKKESAAPNTVSWKKLPGDNEIDEEIYQSASKSANDQDIQESINEYLEEEFEVQSSISQEIKESIPNSEIKESLVRESIADSVIKESIIKESLQNSDIKESISQFQSQVKESIQEENYAEDFEEESQGVRQTTKGKSEPFRKDDYYDEKFESFSSEQSKMTKKKSVTFDESADKLHKESQERASLLLEKPNLNPPDELKLIRPRIYEEDDKQILRARKEAEVELERCRGRYRELRKLQLGDMEDLRKEHFEFRKVEKDVDDLLKSTGSYMKEWKQELKHEPQKIVGKADLLYSKFQFEFHRLLTVNSLGQRLDGILGKVFPGNATGVSTQFGEIPGLQTVLHSIEKQQLVVQEVLSQVLLGLQSWMTDQDAVSELRLCRQEMDQKMGLLLVKQDRLLNDRLKQELDARDKSLRQFLLDLFGKQQKVVVGSNDLKEAFRRNQGAFQEFQKMDLGASAKKSQREEQSEYQPDFENDTEGQQSQRIKTNESELQGSQELRDLASSFSVDKEVNDLVMSQEIDWQIDINLFDNLEKNQQDKLSEKKTQQVVDFLTQMLLNEIKEDLFPIREGEPQQKNNQSEKQPVKQIVKAKEIPIVEEADNSKQKKKNQEEEAKKKQDESSKKQESEEVKKEDEPRKKDELKIISLPKKESQKKKEEDDDFGMAKPLFNRHELEEELEVGGVEGKKVDLIDNPQIAEVKMALEESVQKLLAKKDEVIKKVLTIVQAKTKNNKKNDKNQNEMLSAKLAQEINFLKLESIPDDHLKAAVQALQEQLVMEMMKVIADSFDSPAEKQKLSLAKHFSGCLKQAKQRVGKIAEKLVPVDFYDLKKTGFEEVYKLAIKSKVPKEDEQNFEVQDYRIKQEADQVANQVKDNILRLIIKETLQEFEGIAKNRKNKKK